MNPPDFAPTTTRDSRPLSAMAVASLVFGLLFCIPGAGLLGTIFGFVGIAGTGAKGARRGRGIAFSGTVLSLLSLVGQIVLLAWALTVGGAMFSLFLTGPQDVMNAAANGDRTALAEYFFSDELPSDAETIAFIQAITAEAGAFQSAQLSDNGQPPRSPAPGQTMELPFTFKFAKGTRSGVVSFVVADDGRTTGSGLPVAIRSITISSDDGTEFILKQGATGIGSGGFLNDASRNNAP